MTSERLRTLLSAHTPRDASPLLLARAVGLVSTLLIAAIFGLTFLSALAGSEFKFIEVLILAIVLAVGSWAAFVWGLNLQFQVWPSFISG